MSLSSSRLISLAIIALVLSGCASSKYKARQEQREKVAQTSGLFCEFVNGEQNTDLDVELNFQMAKRCEAGQPFSITNYKNSSDMFGIVYCCQLAGSEARRVAKSRPRSGPVRITPAAPKADATAPTKSEPASSEAEDEIIED